MLRELLTFLAPFLALAIGITVTALAGVPR
jgi:hypothetical protein